MSCFSYLSCFQSVVYFVRVYVIIFIQYEEIFIDYECHTWFENRAYTGEQVQIFRPTSDQWFDPKVFEFCCLLVNIRTPYFSGRGTKLYFPTALVNSLCFDLNLHNFNYAVV